MDSRNTMAETVELGGNIALTGFSEIDGASMIILKKILGSCVKEISENDKEFKRFELVLDGAEPYKMTAVLTAKEEKKTNASDNNLFIALNTVLGDLNK